MGAGANDRECLDLRRFAYSRKAAIHLTLIFVLTGAVWIVVTDVLLYRWVSDAKLLARLETAKGWAFVAVAGVLIYSSASRSLAAVQRSDAMRRAILDNMNDGVFLLGPDKTVIGVNAATARMLGVTDPATLLGMSADDASRIFRLCTPNGKLIPPEQYASSRALRGEIVDTYTALVHPIDKPPLAISITSAPVRATPDGPVELSVTILRDVDAIHRLECMRDDFFSSAAHALETPVTTISLHAELLAARDESAATRRVAAVLQRQCARIEWLVRNLLVASRVRHGSLTFHMEPVELQALAREAADEVGAREPRLVLELDIGGYPSVFGDRERLALVLSNLIVKGYRPACGRQAIRMCVTDHDAQIRVAIESPGNEDDVPASAPGELRARFDRVANAGLELFVCEQILEGHGSHLEKGDAELGVSRTWFDLPKLTRPGDEMRA